MCQTFRDFVLKNSTFCKFSKLWKNLSSILITFLKMLNFECTNVRKSCRSCKMLKNNYLLAKISADPAENEPKDAQLPARTWSGKSTRTGSALRMYITTPTSYLPFLTSSFFFFECTRGEKGTPTRPRLPGRRWDKRKRTRVRVLFFPVLHEESPKKRPFSFFQFISSRMFIIFNGDVAKSVQISTAFGISFKVRWIFIKLCERNS